MPFRQLSALLVLAAAALLAACGGAFGGAATPTRAPLPTVTPFPTRAPATATALPRPTHAATPSPAPTKLAATTSVTNTEDGPVTNWMAALDLAAERYAALGDPAAPVTLIEFADFGCPNCRQHALKSFPELRSKYIDTGKVYYVYKDLPVVSVRGDMAAQAAHCAGEQGSYWPYHERLWLAPSEWDRSEAQALAVLTGYARDLQLDAAALEACVRDGRYAPDIQRDADEAFALGIQATPIFVLNDRVIIGSQPLEVFERAIEEVLAAQP